MVQTTVWVIYAMATGDLAKKWSPTTKRSPIHRLPRSAVRINPDRFPHESLIYDLLTLGPMFRLDICNIQGSLIISSVLSLAVSWAFVSPESVGVDSNITILSGITISIEIIVNIRISLRENMLQRIEQTPNDLSMFDIVRTLPMEIGEAVVTWCLTTKIPKLLGHSFMEYKSEAIVSVITNIACNFWMHNMAWLRPRIWLHPLARDRVATTFPINSISKSNLDYLRSSLIKSSRCGLALRTNFLV